MMKKILGLLILILALTACAFNDQKKISEEIAVEIQNIEINRPRHILLNISQNNENTQMITWKTDIKGEKISKVQFVEKSKFTDFKGEVNIESGEVFEFKTQKEGEAFNIHKVVLKNLKQDTQYVYRVGNGKIWSEKCEFKTGIQEGKYKFLVFGDSQSGSASNPDYKAWEETIKNACKLNKDASFFINVGDLVEIGQDYAHWKNWFEAIKGTAENIQFAAVQGNHETLSIDSDDKGKPSFWINQLLMPQNGPDNLKNQVYSFDYGDVHFVVLNTQEEEEKHINGSIIEPQKIWFEEDLQKTDKKWKIVFIHKPLYCNSNGREEEFLKRQFQPLFDKYKVDIVFTAHDHVVARTYFIKEDNYFSKPSEGTLYYATGRSGAKAYPNVSKKVWNTYFYAPLEKPNYMTVEVDGFKIKIDSFSQDGTIIDSYKIDKEKDEDEPKTVLPEKTEDVILILNGKIMPVENLKAVQLIEGKWYLSAKIFSKEVEGSLKRVDDNKIRLNMHDIRVTFNLTEKNCTVDGKPKEIKDELIINNEEVLISADTIKDVYEYLWHYNEKQNMIFFTKIYN